MPSLHSGSSFPITRASAAELLACVLTDLFPQALMLGGEATDYGFFYDFISDQPMDRQILEILETRLRTLVKEGKEIRSLAMMRENAYEFFIRRNQPILAERALAEEMNIVSLFQLDKFYGLCPEPHVKTTEEVGFVKLLDIEKAERFLPDRGLVEVKRIKGTAFADPMVLKQFLKAYDKLKKADHRILGSELNLFYFSEEVGSVNCFWLEKGKILCDLLIGLWEEECAKSTVKRIVSPLLAAESFLASGKALFPSFSVDERSYLLSSGRLRHHIELFKYRAFDRSEWPIRLGEIAQEYEQVEEYRLWGLFRARSYQSDLVSIFCHEEQLSRELNYSLQFIEQIITIFDFEVCWYLVASGSSKFRVGDRNRATDRLKSALEACSISYELDEDQGEPRIEARMIDSLGREWVGPVIEIVLSAKERLKNSGLKVTPEVLTLRVFGSIDRFVGLLIEQGKGFIPFRFAPEQIRVIAMGEQNRKYAELVCEKCRLQGRRTYLDSRDEKLGTKIHAAEKEKVPYLLIIGDKEVAKNQVSVRELRDKDRIYLTDSDDFLMKLQKEDVESAGGINNKLGS